MPGACAGGSIITISILFRLGLDCSPSQSFTQAPGSPVQLSG
jgi:hypothetical protein